MKSNEVNKLGTPNLFVSSLWLFLHTVFTWIEYLLRLLRRCRKAIYHIQPLGTAIASYRVKQSQQYVKSQLQTVAKIPTHLVVLLGPEQPDYQRLSQFIYWSHAAGIAYVSFYDHNGTIKRNHEQIKRCVNESPLEEKTHIRWLDHNHESLDTERVPSNRTRTLVSFLSPEDGKQGLVSLSRSIGESVRRRDLFPSDVSIEFLDSRLQASSGYVPDPDLAIYFGEVCSTYGLLPWQIRLTEFMQLGWCLEDSNEHHFVDCLLRFAKCEQRLGT
ncbi:dehydrodolichyl diphosphate synthase complex subunit nus1 [Anopheles funestus]|uniref:ditrans,polycis-polyprenyl diphosphate synthase [(2E,6E)-farnesyldiphosphate specific] n=1 Tax=Anopheles funestus TaxID=62324 RepID=A0A182RKX9_ANOFN|nr:dehydrodolichyl diphosphate synthase complex subunit nus1 [Anopheles funestus]